MSIITLKHLVWVFSSLWMIKGLWGKRSDTVWVCPVAQYNTGPIIDNQTFAWRILVFFKCLCVINMHSVYCLIFVILVLRLQVKCMRYCISLFIIIFLPESNALDSRNVIKAFILHVNYSINGKSQCGNLFCVAGGCPCFIVKRSDKFTLLSIIIFDIGYFLSLFKIMWMNSRDAVSKKNKSKATEALAHTGYLCSVCQRSTSIWHQTKRRILCACCESRRIVAEWRQWADVCARAGMCCFVLGVMEDTSRS